MSRDVVILEIRFTVLPRLAELIFSLQSRQDWHVIIPGPRVVVVVPEVVVVELVEEVEEAVEEVVVEPAGVVVVDVMEQEYLHPVTPSSFHPLDFAHVLESPAFAFER
jgi:hypothetical protein